MHKIWNILMFLMILKWCITFLYVLSNQSYDCMNWNVSEILHVHDKKVVVWTRPIGLKVWEGLHLKPKKCHRISLSEINFLNLLNLYWLQWISSIFSILAIFHDFNDLYDIWLPWLRWLLFSQYILSEINFLNLLNQSTNYL